MLDGKKYGLTETFPNIDANLGMSLVDKLIFAFLAVYNHDWLTVPVVFLVELRGPRDSGTV